MAGGVEFLPKEYGYVPLVIVVYTFLNFYMAGQVGMARKKYNVPYPTMYASEAETKDAKLFNCVQRGHQNSLEAMPLFYVLMVLGGIKHPIICAALGIAYVVTRFFYFKGYSTGVADNRHGGIGRFWFIPLFGLIFCTVSFGVSLLLS